MQDDTKVQVCLSATEATYLLDVIKEKLQQSDNTPELTTNLNEAQDKINDALSTAILIM